MKNRREFLKEMAAGVAVLGAESKFASGGGEDLNASDRKI